MQVHDVGPMEGAGVRRPLPDTEFEEEGGGKPRVGLAWVFGGGGVFPYLRWVRSGTYLFTFDFGGILGINIIYVEMTVGS